MITFTLSDLQADTLYQINALARTLTAYSDDYIQIVGTLQQTAGTLL